MRKEANINNYEGESFMPSDATPLEKLLDSEEQWILAVARVSDASQRPALPGQRKRLIEYARSKGLKYAYVEIDDESAYTGSNRKEFRRVIEALKRAKSS